MSLDYWQDLSEVVSLALTVPTIALSIGVLVIWGPSAVRAVREGLTAHGWFILGVVSGFAGSTLDNIYWAIPWTASYFESESAPFLVSIGPFFNIVFRQSLGIMAAVCHLKAATLSQPGVERKVNILIFGSHVLGFVIGVLLWWAK